MLALAVLSLTGRPRLEMLWRAPVSPCPSCRSPFPLPLPRSAFQVKTLTGKEIEIDIEPTDTVQRIKERVEEKEGIPPVQQRWVQRCCCLWGWWGHRGLLVRGWWVLVELHACTPIAPIAFATQVADCSLHLTDPVAARPCRQADLCGQGHERRQDGQGLQHRGAGGMKGVGGMKGLVVKCVPKRSLGDVATCTVQTQICIEACCAHATLH